MKNLSFAQLAIVGFLLSGIGYASFEAFNLIYIKSLALQVSITLCGLIYLVYLTSQSQQKVGKISSTAIYCVVSFCLLYLAIPSTLFAISTAAYLWFIRCFFFHRTFIAIASDASLTLLGLGVAYWTILETSSLFLGLWSFFLIQALLPYIPNKIKQNSDSYEVKSNQKFESAYRNAQAAINRLNQLN